MRYLDPRHGAEGFPAIKQRGIGVEYLDNGIW
jgi:hypothetical protein